MTSSRAGSDVAYAGSEYDNNASSEQESRQLFEEQERYDQEYYQQEFHQQEPYTLIQFQEETDLYSRLNASSSNQTNEHEAVARDEIHKSQEAFGEVGKRTQQKKRRHKGNTNAAKKSRDGEKKRAFEKSK